MSHTGTYIDTYITLHTYIHTYTYTYIHIRTYTHIHIHTDMYECIHTYIHTYTHIHTYIHTYTYIYIHTYTYIQTDMHVLISHYVVNHTPCHYHLHRKTQASLIKVVTARVNLNGRTTIAFLCWCWYSLDYVRHGTIQATISSFARIFSKAGVIFLVRRSQLVHKHTALIILVLSTLQRSGNHVRTRDQNWPIKLRDNLHGWTRAATNHQSLSCLSNIEQICVEDSTAELTALCVLTKLSSFV